MVSVLKMYKSVAILTLITTGIHASVSNLIYNNQKITYVGTAHVYDPNDSQYKTLVQELKKFLKETTGQPCCMVLEQETIHKIYSPSLKDSITSFGDCGAALYLGQQHNIPIIAGDPLKKLAFRLLAASNDFDPDHVRYACFVLLLEMYNRNKENKIKINTDYIEKEFKQIFPEASLNNMITLHEKLTERTFNVYDYHFYRYVSFYPPPFSLRGIFLYQFPALGEIRKIMCAYHLKRDIATIAIIKEQLLAGKHIFIMYGRAHQQFHIQGIQKIITGIAKSEFATQATVDPQ